MGSVMEGFGSANEKAEDKFLGIESQKLDLEKKRLDLEKSRMESDERQKREERQHQYNMMKMIMGAVGERPVVQTGVPPGPSTLYQAPAVPYGPPTPSAQVTTQRDQGRQMKSPAVSAARVNGPTITYSNSRQLDICVLVLFVLFRQHKGIVPVLKRSVSI